MRISINKILFKTSNYAGYIAGGLLVIYFITGYGMTKAIIDPVFAKSLHEKWMPIPMVIACLLHIFIKVKFVLRKWIKDEIWLDIYMIILGLVIFTAFLYLYFL